MSGEWRWRREKSEELEGRRCYGSAVSARDEMRGVGRLEERCRVECMTGAIDAVSYLGHRQECLCYWIASDLRAGRVRGWDGFLGRAFGHGMPCPYCGKKNDVAFGCMARAVCGVGYLGRRRRFHGPPTGGPTLLRSN